ncbi:MAG: hypothetical protein KDA87_02685 [Planctomycetales bacterium]|nr:hypothetical protein [Planctomycetales bacterium]
MRIIFWILVFASTVTGVDAQDFAIVSKVFQQGQEQPVSETLTIFHGSRVYDELLDNQQQISVHDAIANRFHLIDMRRHEQAVISEDDVLEFVAKVAVTTKAYEPDQSNVMVRFAAEPTFDTEFDADAMKLTLSSDVWVYEVDVVRPHGEPDVMVHRYRQFADWFARLNTLWGHLPPNARMELNSALAKHKVIPTRVTATIRNDRGDVILQQHSEHKIYWKLQLDQQRRYQDVDEAIESAKYVSFDIFRGRQIAKAAPKQNRK